jgi:Xaa-Pro aminopeptidase
MIINEKIQQAKQLLGEFNIDCWITFVRESSICRDPSLVFLAKSDVTWHSAFIISKDGKAQAMVGKFDAAAISDLQAYDQVEAYIESIKPPLQAYLKKLNPQTIALNYSQSSEICDGLTHGMYLIMVEFLKELGMEKRIVSAESLISALRERKSQTEINHMLSAIQHTENIFKAVSKFIKPGKTEQQIAYFMVQQVEKLGLQVAWDPSSCPSVFTGPVTVEAHYNPTTRQVEKGHVLNMDFGVKINEYCSDMQRTFYILKDGETAAPAEVMKGFNTIVSSIAAAKDAMKPGITGLEIDRIARDMIVAEGYSEYPHALGHQVGRFAHDGTALLAPAWEKYRDKPMKKLEKGMVFTLEPRLTIPGRGVATIEEMVLVTEDGCQWLSHPQTEIILIK